MLVLAILAGSGSLRAGAPSTFTTGATMRGNEFVFHTSGSVAADIDSGAARIDVVRCYEAGMRGDRVGYIATEHRLAYEIGRARRAASK